MATRRRLALDVLTALLAIAGVTLVVIGGSPPPGIGNRPAELAAVDALPGPVPTTAAVPSGAVPSARTPSGAVPSARTPSAATGRGLPRSEPVRLDIPAIHLSTSLMTLGLNPDGTMAVPPLRHDAPAGWYRYLATPGEVGPAVIVGHVDTARDGPAVFYRLSELRPGDTIAVRRLDGRTAVFTVEQVAQYPKSAFPAQAVYGAVDRPALRLVTCGGSFDRVHRQYRGNVIVFATLTS